MIDAIEFGVLSPKMIKDMSAVRVEHAELYDPDGYPIEGGLCDLRMGVVDPGLRCATCGGKIGQCLGHFGYLELTKPVIHPLFGKKIFKLLKSTCSNCSRILATEEDVKKMKGDILTQIYKKPQTVCPYCGQKQKKITYEKPTTYIEEDKELNPEEIRQRFEKITDEDLELMKIGGGRPEWLVLTLLPIPSATTRPSITLETGERSEDDLTHKLVDIVRINERLRKNLELGAPEFIIDDIWALLQYHVSTLMDNEISTLPPARHRSGRALRTLIQRLSKKEGRFRSNLTGKRVNFSARTVISPDPMISINEVGVPEVIAKDMTIPEKVTKSNIDKLRKLILNGPNVHPGVNYVLRPDGIKKRVIDENKEEIANEIEAGYIVERHLMDGDVVLFNRQPSLHRVSMMAHLARIMPYKTFRLHLAVTTPYNADFDGDEMNLHVPQTQEAIAEAKMLMLVEKHMRSPRYGAPIIACKHEYITGAYLLTKKDTKINKKDAARLLASIGMEDEIELKNYYTGKEIFSMLLPDDLDLEFKASISSAFPKDTDSYVVIKNGKLKQGAIDEMALGDTKGKIIDKIEKLYGHERARDFINRVSRLILEYISIKGFTVSIDDEEVSEKTNQKIRDVLKETDTKVNNLIKKYEKGTIELIPGKTLKDSFEENVLRLSAESLNEAGKIIKTHIPITSATIMAMTGARGSFVNITQISGFVGQETIGGARVKRGYTGRTLPHFAVGSIGLKAHGFVSHGYREGLDPIEFFYDAMNSRENLMDKSLQTRHSGYMERRLVNALQDLKVEYDFTVRDSKNHIIQFTAGEDGIDPSKSDRGTVDLENIKHFLKKGDKK